MSEKIFNKFLKCLGKGNCSTILNVVAGWPPEKVREFIESAYAHASGEILVSAEFQSLERRVRGNDGTVKGRGLKYRP